MAPPVPGKVTWQQRGRRNGEPTQSIPSPPKTILSDERASRSAVLIIATRPKPARSLPVLIVARVQRVMILRTRPAGGEAEEQHRQRVERHDHGDVAHEAAHATLTPKDLSAAASTSIADWA